jgi:2-amino-4-hydroxy-6-hydroxymethyldihydropteridine diphosphokinase
LGEFVITCYVALGANVPSALGGPRETLEAALAAFGDAGLRLVARSRWYRTPAYPPGAGPEFVNGVAAVETALDPRGVLDALHRIEAGLGRRRDERWAPRTCDLDLIACGQLVLPDAATQGEWAGLPVEERRRAPQGLVLPHPRMQERVFVLRPLCDLAPEWRHPVLGRTAAELLAALPAAERAEIELL